MTGFPDRSEAVEYYFTYIDKAQTTDILGHLETQSTEFLHLLDGISEESSLHRYEPGKWSLREALSHINDTERVFGFRAFWVARGAQPSLPSFEQDAFVANSGADTRRWSSHVDEFIAVRAGTMALLRSLPAEAWLRRGLVNNNPVTARALAFMVAGHVEHHRQIIVARYLR